MLQEVQGITPSASMGIASEYPTFKELMEAFEKAERRGGVERAEGMLQDCEVCIWLCFRISFLNGWKKSLIVWRADKDVEERYGQWKEVEQGES